MMRSTTLAALAAAAGAATSALAQFTNADFETGDLTGWTVANTFNGITAFQNAQQVDIDGPGPLGTNFAAAFRVGNAISLSSFQAGIEIWQDLNLTAGTGYQFDCDFAAINTSTSGNAEGGVFQMIVEDRRLGAAVASGSTTSTTNEYGHLTRVFSPQTSGPYRVGVRITRPFTNGTPTLTQHLDNFAVTTGATVGACCLPDGTCFSTGSAECTVAGGTYGGDGVTCAAAACVQPGSCCVPDAGCFIRSSAQCTVYGGVYGGNGTTCATAGCTPAAFAFGPIANRAADAGSSTSNPSPIASTVASTMQFCMTASELEGLAPGSTLTGMTWRLDNVTANNTAWPTVDITYSQYDVEICTGGGAPSFLSPTFASNLSGNNVQVRTGALTIPAGSFPGGATTGTVNGWGFVIPFTTPFVYNGGPLNVTIRRSVSTPTDGNRAVDSITNSNAAYFNTVQAINGTTVVATTGGTMPAPVVRFTVGGGGPAPCYPNCDNSTTPPILNVQDFGCFLNSFGAGETYANCDLSTTPPVLNVQDFGCFLNAFSAGCS